MFQVKNGAITNGDAPYMPLYMNTTSGKSYMLGLNIFSGPTTVEGGHYALLSGNSPDVVRGVSKWNTDGWYNQQIGDKYAEYSSAEIGIFKHNMNDPVQMVIGGKQYLTYVSGSSPQGTLRLVDITGEDGLLTRIMNLGSAENVESQSTIYPLAVPGDAAGSGRRGHNGTGFLTTTEISGVTYVLAGVTEAGISCFKVD